MIKKYKRLLVLSGLGFCLLALPGCGGTPLPSLIQIILTGTDLSQIKLYAVPNDNSPGNPTECSEATAQPWCASSFSGTNHSMQFESDFAKIPFAIWIENESATTDIDVHLEIRNNGNLTLNKDYTIPNNSNLKAAKVFFGSVEE